MSALQVTPLSLNTYLTYRIAIPVVLTFVMMFIIFPLSALDDLTPLHIMLTATAAAPLAPMFALTHCLRYHIGASDHSQRKENAQDSGIAAHKSAV